MEIQYMAKKWAAAEWLVILAFVIVFLVFLYIKGGEEPFLHVMNSYYGILLILLVFLYYKIGLWSAIPLYVVAVASLARGVFNNPDVTEEKIERGLTQEQDGEICTSHVNHVIDSLTFFNNCYIMQAMNENLRSWSKNTLTSPPIPCHEKRSLHL